LNELKRKGSGKRISLKNNREVLVRGVIQSALLVLEQLIFLTQKKPEKITRETPSFFFRRVWSSWAGSYGY